MAPTSYDQETCDSITYHGANNDLEWSKTITIYNSTVTEKIAIESVVPLGEHTITNYADMDVIGASPNIGIARGTAGNYSLLVTHVSNTPNFNVAHLSPLSLAEGS